MFQQAPLLHLITRGAKNVICTTSLSLASLLTAQGAITYNAPGGYHDDCVIALALANSARFEHRWTGEARVFGARRVEQGVRVGRRGLM